LTSALVGGEWSASRPGSFTPGERVSYTHWIGGPVRLLNSVADIVSKHSCGDVISDMYCVIMGRNKSPRNASSRTVTAEPCLLITQLLIVWLALTDAMTLRAIISSVELYLRLERPESNVQGRVSIDLCFTHRPNETRTASEAIMSLKYLWSEGV
jgi:hypothetical protein